MDGVACVVAWGEVQQEKKSCRGLMGEDEWCGCHRSLLQSHRITGLTGRVLNVDGCDRRGDGCAMGVCTDCYDGWCRVRTWLVGGG